MDRRSFLASLAAAPLALPATRRLNRIGLELYTVRAAMRADPVATLGEVAKMGYKDVELLWSHKNFGQSPNEVRATLDRFGLKAPSSHVDPEILLDRWSEHLETAKLLGQDYIIVPSLPGETKTSLDAWRRWADNFNRAGEAARRAGIWLAFHNEPDHMKPIDGLVPYDVFVERTDPSLVRLQLDVGNMAMGGGDPVRYLERLRERYWSFHIKDVVADGLQDTELGTGRLDFKRILGMIPEIDRKPCYIEQEGPKDPMASARRDIAYLRSLEF
jgi:sugar phosphate isomerase/epimerase